MVISGIDLFLLELPLREPFVAGHGTTSTRTITMVRVSSDRGSGSGPGPGSASGHGWGECSALPSATYTSESAAESFEALADQMAPRLLGRPVDHRDVPALLADFADRPMAVSSLEMAVLDTELRLAGRSLANWLGAVRTTVPAGVSIGLAPIDDTVDKAVDLAAAGYRRLKLKIQPGHDLEPVAAVRRRLASVELHVDANGAYGPDDVELLLELVDRGVDALEQPFAPDEVAAAATLIAELSTRRPVPLVADEAVESAADAVELLNRRALTGLSIKPARVGGLVAAVELHELCRTHDLAATAGGMLETGLGRRALAALAALPGFTLTGDLSPAGRWLAADPWPDLRMVDGTIIVPSGPGIAPDPDPTVLSRTTIDRRSVGR